MKTAVQATAISLFGLALFGLALFWPAGTFNYWQAWVFIGLFAVLSVISTVYLGVKNPQVLRRRMRSGPVAETRPVQKMVAAGVYVMFTALLVVSALDHRFGWSHVPAAVSVWGDVLVAVGLGIAMLVVMQNSYAAATITVEEGQTVVSTGLYGLVRHPMYSGSLIMLVGIPLALGSYWGLLVLIPAPIGLVFRIRDEEEALTEELDGYREYAHRALPTGAVCVVKGRKHENRASNDGNVACWAGGIRVAALLARWHVPLLAGMGFHGGVHRLHARTEHLSAHQESGGA